MLIDDLQLGSGIEAYVFNQDYKCIDRMNNASGKLADTAAKIDAKCVGTQFKLGGGDATPCVDDPLEPKTNARETKQLSDYVTHCPASPAWGVNGASCCEDGTNEGLTCAVPPDCPGGSCLPGACLTHAAEYAANDLAHDIFGAGVAVSPTGFAACVAERTQCAFCRAVNVADDIVPALDCDLFDDAIANLSCP